MKKYAKLIWQNVLRYTLLDFLTSVFITGILYLFTKLICIFINDSNPFSIYALQSVKLLGLLYILSISATSYWCHLKLFKHLSVNEVKKEPPLTEENDSSNNTTSESEVKC